MSNLSFTDVIDFLEKSEDYHFHARVWLAYITTVDFDEKYKRDKELFAESGEFNGYFRVLTENVETEKYNPLIPAIIMSGLFDDSDYMPSDDKISEGYAYCLVDLIIDELDDSKICCKIC